MEVSDFAPILVQIIFAAVLAGVNSGCHFLGHSRKSSIKDSAYECGIKSEGRRARDFRSSSTSRRCSLSSSISRCFLIPWALIYRDFLAEGLLILGPIMFFLAVLVIGLVYEIKKGGLEEK